MYRRFCRRLKEKKAACALTGWLYGPQGMPRHRAQAARTLCLSGWSSDIHIVCRVCAAAGQFGEAMGVPVHILLKKPAKGLLHIC